MSKIGIFKNSYFCYLVFGSCIERVKSGFEATGLSLLFARILNMSLSFTID